jgi:hypothetical protein
MRKKAVKITYTYHLQINLKVKEYPCFGTLHFKPILYILLSNGKTYPLHSIKILF